jgi:hypothetical protein
MHRRRNLQPGVSPAAVALVPPVYPPRPRWATPRPSLKPAGRATRRRQTLLSGRQSQPRWPAFADRQTSARLISCYRFGAAASGRPAAAA